MSLITIFTPTYNRAYTLPKLYDSLCRQIDKDFEWIIVDDGSTDNTKDIIDEWIKENKIKIKYFFQENSGKMKAHNFVINVINTEWFLCVDSDDFIVDDCIQKIKQNILKVKSNKCSGIVAYKGKSVNEKLFDSEFPQKDYSTLKNIYAEGFKGDTTLVFKSEIIKKYHFPNIENENFMTEGYIYDQIDQCYELFILPEILTICKYLNDGYTKNIYKIYFKNPISMMLYYEQAYKLEKRFWRKIKIAINFNCYLIEAKNKKKNYSYEDKLVFKLMYIPGNILRYRMKRKIK